MKAEFLDVEAGEIQRELTRKNQAEFNEWFGSSEIKYRLKKACMKAQSFRCCYCKKFINSDSAKVWDLEHILCESLYPQFYSDPMNLAVSCQRCNLVKLQKDVLVATYVRPPVSVPLAAADYTIPHPHLTNWDEHLRHTLYILYEGITPQGKELMKCCKLNAEAEHILAARAGTVKVAAENDVFAMIGAAIPDGSNIDGHKLSSLVIEMTENAHIEALMLKIDMKLEELRRAAERRNASKDGGEKLSIRKRKRSSSASSATS